MTYNIRNVILEESPEWEIRRYGGYAPNGAGDCISRSTGYDYDNRTWKYGDTCYKLLKAKKRWPDELNDPAQCNSILASAYYKTKFHICKWLSENIKALKDWNWTVKYRSQNDMTRDPYIYFYSAAFVNGKFDLIKDLKIPFRLRRPEIVHWRKYLLTGRKIHLIIYILVQGKARLEFVQGMDKVKQECVIMKMQQSIKV